MLPEPLTPQQRYRLRHPDRIKLAKKRWSIKNPYYHKEYNRKAYRRSPIPYLLRCIKGRAKKEGVPFNLTVADIVVPDYCPILGIKLVPFGTGMSFRGNNYSTVDRISPAKGYVKGNIQIISFRANRLKNNATIKELRAILTYMERSC